MKMQSATFLNNGIVVAVATCNFDDSTHPVEIIWQGEWLVDPPCCFVRGLPNQGYQGLFGPTMRRIGEMLKLEVKLEELVK